MTVTPPVNPKPQSVEYVSSGSKSLRAVALLLFDAILAVGGRTVATYARSSAWISVGWGGYIHTKLAEVITTEAV